jgi:transcriptional regulator with XRE-family HTH domain
MSNTIPANFLKAHRRKSGLTQREVAAILGCADSGIISRYERSRHLPPLLVALAFEALFRVPVSKLFAGAYESINQSVEQRLGSLRQDLQGRSGKGSGPALTERSLLWLKERQSAGLSHN